MIQMTLGDFSSVVLLGVGLHAGTAILQSVGEFTGTPLSRRIERLKLLAEVKAKRESKYTKYFDDACDLLGDLEVKKVQFFNIYKKIVLLNAGVAGFLCVLLAILAFFAKCDVSASIGISIVAVSFCPAAWSLHFLRNRWTRNTKGLSQKIVDLEAGLLAPPAW